MYGIQSRENIALYETIKRSLRDIGYTNDLLKENYKFADILAPIYTVRTIPLATFAQDPPSYQNACFGVIFSNGKSGESLVEDYRSLGAPQIMEITSDRLCRRWRMTSRDVPELLDQVEPQNITSLFQTHKHDWSPNNILRAKAIGQEHLASQLDFFDLGLLPLLEKEVRVKLDRLLHNTLSASIETYERQHTMTPNDYPPLFRLIFRLIAAKVLGDRGHPGKWIQDDPRCVIDAVQEFYFKEAKTEQVLQDYNTQMVAWDRIKKSFYFQNLSVDALAYVYENTLVSKETRKLYGTHSTPSQIAEYIVKNLPFEDLEEQERRVFEPFAGHAVFLVAAMRRMRDLLPTYMGPKQRHDYFVRMLSGLEIDDFAREVARLSLMLADFPNPDGWRLNAGDVFQSPIFNNELSSARVVLCNPPFEDFKPADLAKYTGLRTLHRPAEILHRVLEKPPYLLGFVLPRVFIDGRGYREVRSLLGNSYSSIEVVALPDSAFLHSDAEAVLIIASGRPKNKKLHLVTGGVYERDLETFYATRIHSYQSKEELEVGPRSFDNKMWLPILREVWEAAVDLKRLFQVADVHRGGQYNLNLRDYLNELVSTKPRPGFSPGLHRAMNTLEPFRIRNVAYLNMNPEVMRDNAYKLPWDKPKVVLNKHRASRGPWAIIAVPDYQGLYCYQDFNAVWPTSNLPLEVLTAILNGPLASAFVATHEGKRDVRVITLRQIPIPDLTPAQIETITTRVNEYRKIRDQWLSDAMSPEQAQELCRRLLALIDAEVLKAYDLAPKLERSLLDQFRGHLRPGPVKFTEYFPSTFKPFIPWHLYISQEFQDAAARATLERLSVINDPLISKVMSDLNLGSR